jgi:hypothetical protein
VCSSDLEKLILCYSGGYDSHTIYDVFAKNRIHLDAIVVSASRYASFFPVSTYEWVKTNHWDPHTEIIVTDADDLSQNQAYQHSKDWIFSDLGHLVRYHSAVWWATQNIVEQKFGHTDWCMVTGYEKPRLIYRNNQWFSRQMASVVDQNFGRPRIEAFFLEPLIAIKQSHLLKNNTMELIKLKNLPLNDEDWAEVKFGNTHWGMHYWNLSSGRIPELNLGVSYNQKILSQQTTGLNNINHTGHWKNIEVVSPHSRLLIDDLKNDKVYAKNFLEGIYELHSQTTLINHFKHNQLFTSARQSLLYDLPPIWSKEYCIGS